MTPVIPQKSRKSGSLKKSEPEFLLAGKLLKPHGLRGELWLKILTDFPELFFKGGFVFIGESYQKFKINSVRHAGEKILISFDGMNNLDKARELNNSNVFLSSEQMPALEKDLYYHHQLIGLKVINQDGLNLGDIVEVLQTGANDIYIIRSDDEQKKELLIPAIDSVVKKIDIPAGVMVISELNWYD